MMTRLRAWTMVLVGLVATLLVSCGGPATTIKIPTTYTESQLSLIRGYSVNIEENAQRFAQLETAIAAADWQMVRTVMRGPLGQMILDMRNLNRNLLTKVQKNAADLTRGLVTDLLAVDQAAIDQDVAAAQKAFKAAKAKYEDYLTLIPQA